MTTRKLETGTPDLIAEVTGHVATVTLNNPARRNALSAGMTANLPALLDALEADAQVRVLVLTEQLVGATPVHLISKIWLQRPLER